MNELTEKKVSKVGKFFPLLFIKKGSMSLVERLQFLGIKKSVSRLIQYEYILISLFLKQYNSLPPFKEQKGVEELSKTAVYPPYFFAMMDSVITKNISRNMLHFLYNSVQCWNFQPLKSAMIDYDRLDELTDPIFISKSKNKKSKKKEKKDLDSSKKLEEIELKKEETIEVKEEKKEIKKFDINVIMNAQSGGRKRKRTPLGVQSVKVDPLKVGRKKYKKITPK